MILTYGTTTVSTAGTEQQLSNTTSRVMWLKVKALAANSGKAYFGLNGLTSGTGYELSAGNELEINFSDILFSTLYVDVATNGDKVSWVAVVDG